ncbi:MAG: glycosyltransferase family 39 protein [Acidobacteria bacterium]|nr:glycosyltransferase family 39 protein [Acidobacteriota bacterium]
MGRGLRVMEVRAGSSPDVDRWAPRVRGLLAAAGAALPALALGAGPLGLQTSAPLGPLQIQVAALGLALMALAIANAPARAICEALQRARDGRGTSALAPPATGTRLRLAAIVLAAFALRGWLAVTYVPPVQMAMGMTLWDAEMARNLLAGRGFALNRAFVDRMDRAIVERGARVDPQDFLPADDAGAGALAPFALYPHTPGYPLWLAASFLLGGSLRFVHAQLLQGALDALGCLLVFGIGRRLWTSAAGLIGASVYALSPAHAYVSTQAVAAATDAFWVLLVGYGLVRMWDDHRRGRSMREGTACVAAGALCGAAMNSFALVLPLAALAWAALVGVIVRPAWRLVLPLLAAQVVVLALLTPWALRNQRVYGELAFTRQTFWQFAWETLGAIPNPWGLAIGNNDEAYWKWVDANCAAPCTPAARESATRDYLVRHVFPSPGFPGHLARLVAHQLPGLLYVSRFPADVRYAYPGLAGRVTRLALSIADASMLLLWPLALCGLAMTARCGAEGAGAWLGLAPTLTIVGFSLVFLVEHRRTTSGYGYLIALAALPVSALVQRHADRH